MSKESGRPAHEGVSFLQHDLKDRPLTGCPSTVLDGFVCIPDSIGPRIILAREKCNL